MTRPASHSVRRESPVSFADGAAPFKNQDEWTSKLT